MESIEILLALATLAVILFGLGVVAITMFWPSLLLVVFVLFVDIKIAAILPYLLTAAIVNVIHLYTLYTDANHVAVYQFLWLPIRRLLVPVVLWVARMESIREGTPTLYRKIECNVEITLSRGIRRRYRKMEEIFRESKLRHETVYSDQSGLAFSQFLPVLWEHQQRICPSDAVGEFIKRFLVIALMPDGIFDLYYADDSQQHLVAFQFSMRQGPSVLHWFMYFCKDAYTQKGTIWFHGISLAMKRGEAIATEVPNRVCLVNGHVHQTVSKQNAGLEQADHTSTVLLAQLYPFSFAWAIQPEVAMLKHWQG